MVVAVPSSSSSYSSSTTIASKDGGGWFARLERRLFRPIHPSSFTLVRILYGVLCCEEVWHQQGLADEAFLIQRRIEPRYIFHYKGFAWLPRVDDLLTWKIILYVAMAASIGITMGCCYRLSTIVYAITFSYIYLSEASYYLNHLYLFVCLTWIFTLTEGNTYWALDPYLGWAPKKKSTIAAYNIYIFRLLMSAVYIYAAVAKINYDWLVLGVPLIHWLPKRTGKYDGKIADFYSHLFDTLMSSRSVAHFMSITGMLYDLLIPALFSAGGQWRNLGFCLTCVFHITNKIIFNIGIFPSLSLSLATVYFEFDWPVRVWDYTIGRIIGWLRRRRWGKVPEKTENEAFVSTIKRVWDHTVGRIVGLVYRRFGKGKAVAAAQQENEGEPNEATTAAFVSTYKTKAMTVILLLVASHQILYPLRHYLYPGDVMWNELGHRYSWRMKLRDKVGTVKCGRELRDGTIKEIPASAFLTDKQERTIAGRPEMVEEYAHYLSKHFTSWDGKHCPIYCLSVASVNFRMPQFLLDPRVDLASTPLWSTTAEFFVEFLPRDVTKDHPFVPPVDFDESRIDRRRVRDLFQQFSITDARNHFLQLERLGIIDKPMQKGGVKILDQEAASRWRKARATPASLINEEL